MELHTLSHTHAHSGTHKHTQDWECSFCRMFLAFLSAAHMKTTYPWLHSVQIPLLGECFRMKNAIWDDYKSHWITETWTSTYVN